MANTCFFQDFWHLLEKNHANKDQEIAKMGLGIRRTVVHSIEWPSSEFSPTTSSSNSHHNRFRRQPNEFWGSSSSLLLCQPSPTDLGGQLGALWCINNEALAFERLLENIVAHSKIRAANFVFLFCSHYWHVIWYDYHLLMKSRQILVQFWVLKGAIALGVGPNLRAKASFCCIVIFLSALCSFLLHMNLKRSLLS